MDDGELKQIREARLRELKKQNPNAGGAPDKKDEMKAAMLPQLLTQEARERLNRVRIVKPERADQVEQMLMHMAQIGQLGQKLGERELVSLLDTLAQREQQSGRIVISRRETDLDNDVPHDPHGAAHGAAHSTTKAPTSPGAAANDSDSDDFFD